MTCRNYYDPEMMSRSGYNPEQNQSRSSRPQATVSAAQCSRSSHFSLSFFSQALSIELSIIILISMFGLLLCSVLGLFISL